MLVNQHPILFATTVLKDIEFGLKIRKVDKNESKRISVLFTTHDRSQAARLAHHTIVLNQGRLVSTLYENVFRGVLQTDPSEQPQGVIQDRMHLSVIEDQVRDKPEAIHLM